MKTNTVFNLNEQEMSEFDSLLAQLEALVKGKFPALTPKERSDLGTINEQNKLLVNKTRDLHQSDPSKGAPEMDWTEFESDYQARQFTETRSDRLGSIAYQLQSANILHDHDNYGDSLTNYSYAKYKEAVGETGYAEIVAELKQFFPRAKIPLKAAATMTETLKNLTWNVGFLGRGVIIFGVRAESFTAQAKQYTAFVKFLGDKANLLTDEAKRFALDTENITPEAKNITIEPKRITPEADDLTGEAKDSAGAAKSLDGQVKRFAADGKRPATAANRSGSEAKSLGREAKSLGHEPKLLGLQPKNLGEQIKIFTFGLFVLKIDSRLRAGFIKRRQILVEA